LHRSQLLQLIIRAVRPLYLSAADKVGNFVKKNGAKIAKFGLKVYATATKTAGRVASFIPGVGKPISRALSGVSKVANFASDKIHADLDKKLTTGMNVMDKIQNPVGKSTSLQRHLNSDSI
jgi:hypothetical protein